MLGLEEDLLGVRKSISSDSTGISWGASAGRGRCVRDPRMMELCKCPWLELHYKNVNVSFYYYYSYYYYYYYYYYYSLVR